MESKRFDDLSAAAMAAAAYFSRTVSRTSPTVAASRVPLEIRVNPAEHPHPLLPPQQAALSDGSQHVSCAAGVEPRCSTQPCGQLP